ncbi:hypothetical protein BCR36DRAFT_371064 [Piromyces finnis]|uniref:G-protein coupled receptors family 1 profile domain-containing protein n=1 Tax=Piromyces finnis TaxID=1754191 RepID=A0A1Y1V835_9FUNG|nr:hypothetical protein BCR36DRAFT_371064 [Piromyces finnis]|eukprot:ORX49001.1 hypothetical protein BCR36DRAFT_371064 [Piromyces finnis]
MLSNYNNYIKYKTTIIFVVLPICQIILLIFWTITNKNGIDKERMRLENVGIYYKDVCSTGNKYFLNSMFIIDYALLLLSIISSYKGRNNVDMSYIYSSQSF